MSHTVRYYNKPNHIKDFYHPYKVLCCGRCPHCRDWRLRSRRRATWKAEVRQRAITDRYWAELEGFEYFDPYDPLDGLVAIYDDYVDWRDGIDYDY